jgi:hypothetical protein
VIVAEYSAVVKWQVVVRGWQPTKWQQPSTALSLSVIDYNRVILDSHNYSIQFSRLQNRLRL